jgi:hypothetical protein
MDTNKPLVVQGGESEFPGSKVVIRMGGKNLIDPEQLYPVSFIISNHGDAISKLTMMYGKDLTDEQIKEYFHFRNNIIPIAVRRKERIGECEHDPQRGTFFEKVDLYDSEGNVIFTSGTTHPESHYSFTFMGFEYHSNPWEGKVYCRPI